MRSRRVVRRVRRDEKPALDATSEVAVEDILLEAYAEDPPPPPSRIAPALIATPPASASIKAAIASMVPPHPAQSAAVDALLRASDPAFAPPASQRIPQAQYAPYGYASPPSPPIGPDFESHSVAPVMMASTTPPPAQPARVVLGRPRNRTAVVALWSALLLVLGVTAGAAAVLGIPDGAYARLRGIKSTEPSTPVAAAAAAAPASPPAAPAAPAADPTPAPTASISVNALPKQEIPPDMALVTFPASANGHRVFVDGRLVTIAADGSPAKIKCGRHFIKIGTARRARITDLACGREVVLQ